MDITQPVLVKLRNQHLQYNAQRWFPVDCMGDPRDAAGLGQKMLQKFMSESVEVDRSLCQFQTAIGFKDSNDVAVHAQIWEYLWHKHVGTTTDKDSRSLLFTPEVTLQWLRLAQFDLFMRFRLAFFEFEAYQKSDSGTWHIKPQYTALLERMCGKKRMKPQHVQEMVRLDTTLRQLECSGTLFVIVESKAEGRVMFYHNNTAHYQRHIMGQHRISPPIALSLLPPMDTNGVKRVCYTCAPNSREVREAMTWGVCRLRAIETKRAALSNSMIDTPWVVDMMAEFALVACAKTSLTCHSSPKKKNSPELNAIKSMESMVRISNLRCCEQHVSNTAIVALVLYHHVNKCVPR